MSGGETTFRDCVNDIIVREYELKKLFQKAVGLATTKEETVELASVANNISKHFVGLRDDLGKGLDNKSVQLAPVTQKVTSAGRNDIPKDVTIPAVPGSSNQITQTANGFVSVTTNVPLQINKPPTDSAVMQGPVGISQEADPCKVFIPDIKGLGRLQLAHYFATKFGNVENVTMDETRASAVASFLFPGTVRSVMEHPRHTIGSEKIFTIPFKNRLHK